MDVITYTSQGTEEGVLLKNATNTKRGIESIPEIRYTTVFRMKSKDIKKYDVLGYLRRRSKVYG